MITSLTLNAAGGSSIDINTAVYPLHEFSPEIDERTDDREKMQDDGLWPTFSYDGKMTIHMAGDILADDSTDFNTKRLALINVLRDYGTPRQRKAGSLDVLFDGQSEHWKTDYRVDAVTIPLTGASPAFAEFTITLVSFTPYFIGVTSSNKHYYT